MSKPRTNPRRVTLADVAREAQVSVSTVSAVLNRKSHCYAAKSTRQHVIDVARRLGYRPNLLARSLRDQRTRTIGLLTFGLNHTAVVNAKIQSIEDAAWRHQYRILIGTHKDEPGRMDDYFDEFLSRSVDGIVFQPPVPQGQRLIEQARATGTPLVTLESPPVFNTWNVGVDRAQGAAMQVAHVLSLGRTPAFLFTSHYSYTGLEKVRGIEQALARAGRSLSEFLVLESPQQANASRQGVRMTEQLLASGRRFDAIITMSDLVAQAVLATLIRCGRRVPDDVAVVGFDDEFAPEGMVVPLTTVRQPCQIGPAVFDLLLQQMRSPHDAPARRLQLEPTLVVRESTVAGAGMGPLWDQQESMR